MQPERLRYALSFVWRTLNPAVLLRRVRTAFAAPSSLVLRARARWARWPMTGNAPVVVSMTSYGERINTVHLALESIAGGWERPSRLILWLEDESVVENPPRPLARMRKRGLEIRHTPDFGPHKKYYPYAASIERHEVPLVTADDDVLYGFRWLRMLLAAHRAHGRDIVAHRAHRLTLRDGQIEPYALWEQLEPHEAGPRTFATGVSGVLYPPHMLDALRDAGTAFMDCAPRADDVWLHATALRTGTAVRPVYDGLTEYRSAPRSRLTGLGLSNIFDGGNDRQIAATYTPEDVELLWRDQLRANAIHSEGK